MASIAAAKIGTPVSASFRHFAETAQHIAETRRTTEKTTICARYLESLGDDRDLALTVQFFGEGAFSTISGKRASIGHRTIATTAARYLEIDYERVFRPSRIATGSASETIEKLMQNLDTAIKKRQNDAQLSLQEVEQRYQSLASARRREEKESILMQSWQQLSPLEVKYFLRIMGGGSLRIGFESRSIINAIAQSARQDPDAVRYVHMITGSLGKTAVMAREGQLEQARFRMFQPIAFMLAAPLESRTVEDYADYIAEEKFDGMRCQLHISGDSVQLYSRDLNEITDSFPDVAADFIRREIPGLVLDGELCVFRNDTIQPFQDLQKRMGVKKPGKTLLQKHPVIFVAYDILFDGRNPLFELPLTERRKLLEQVCNRHQIYLVEQFAIQTESDVEALFNQALLHGNEGLMLKRTDSLYEFGQRKKSWLKVKKPGGTLDTVIIYATAGSGKRGGTYSDFTLGIRVDNDSRYEQSFVPIGKAYGGYTDDDLKKLNTAIKPLIRERFGPTLSLEPQIVVEIEFDEIQVNKRTKAGYTLRLPRFRAIRWDKGPSDSDTLSEVERLYHAAQNRERLPQTSFKLPK